MSELTKKYLTEINQSYAKLYDGVICDFSPDEINYKIEEMGRLIDFKEDYINKMHQELFESDFKRHGWITFCVTLIISNAIVFLAIIS